MSIPLADVLEPALMSELIARSKAVSVKEGEVLLGIGQMVHVIPLVTKGVIRVTRNSEEGHELLLYYVSANESCAMTFTCCMQQFPSQIEARAEEDSEVLLIPITLMDEWMQRYPSWKNFVMSTIRNRFTELLNTIDQIAFRKLDERLLAYLSDKATVSKNKELHISHEQIARELASSREVISRLLKKLENEKVVALGRNVIRLLKNV